MSLELILNNIGYTVATITTVTMAVIVFVKSERRKVKILFALLSTAVAVFEISHLFATNIADPVASHHIMALFNTANIFIIAVDFHFMYYVLGLLKSRRWHVVTFYAVSIALFLFYETHPFAFLALPTPKLYLLNYYNPGPYHFLMILLLCVGFLILIYQILKSYRYAENIYERKRIKYYIFAHLVAYTFGLSAQLLTYDIPFDPVWSAFFCTYSLFFAYAMIKYDLMEIHVIAKRALVYAFVAIVGGLAISIISYSNIWIVAHIPTFPTWLLPFLGSIVAVTIAEFVFWKVKAVDLLKYEFVNIVTHKFRTPLTYINWSTDTLRTAIKDPEVLKSVEKIELANSRLVELTDILVSTSNFEDRSYMYDFRRVSLRKILSDCLDAMKEKVKAKNIKVNFNVENNIRDVLVDARKIEFALQMLLENAVTYNRQNGSVDIDIYGKGRSVVLEIRDSGIGIPAKELQFIFSKFYRSAVATQADTEGLGLGLYIVKNIVERHGARISVSSPGENRGSTFTVTFRR